MNKLQKMISFGLTMFSMFGVMLAVAPVALAACPGTCSAVGVVCASPLVVDTIAADACATAGQNCCIAAKSGSSDLSGDTTLGLSFGGKIGLGSSDIRSTIAQIINVAMGLLGIIAVVIILIGGFTWMTAGGNDEKIETAKKWIFAGIIGLAIILSAYAIARFVINSLVTATTLP